MTGKENGLYLLLDPTPYQLNENHAEADIEIRKYQTFTVAIHTLAEFTKNGPGTYALSTLKRMTGTDSFKQLPDTQKKCQVHNQDECRNQRYIDQIVRECGCLPWALTADQQKREVHHKVQNI